MLMYDLYTARAGANPPRSGFFANAPKAVIRAKQIAKNKTIGSGEHRRYQIKRS
jgi:hypothetical protein